MKVKIYEKMKNEKMIPVKQFYEQWILIGNVECKQFLGMEELQMQMKEQRARRQDETTPAVKWMEIKMEVVLFEMDL